MTLRVRRDMPSAEPLGSLLQRSSQLALLQLKHSAAQMQLNDPGEGRDRKPYFDPSTHQTATRCGTKTAELRRRTKIGSAYAYANTRSRWQPVCDLDHSAHPSDRFAWAARGIPGVRDFRRSLQRPQLKEALNLII